MPKVTIDIPDYLKEWINNHDISQNALVVMGLRKLYLEEQQVPTAKIEKVIKECMDKYKSPF